MGHAGWPNTAGKLEERRGERGARSVLIGAFVSHQGNLLLLLCVRCILYTRTGQLIMSRSERPCCRTLSRLGQSRRERLWFATELTAYGSHSSRDLRDL